jgi:hypothetical protein
MNRSVTFPINRTTDPISYCVIEWFLISSGFIVRDVISCSDYFLLTLFIQAARVFLYPNLSCCFVCSVPRFGVTRLVSGLLHIAGPRFPSPALCIRFALYSWPPVSYPRRSVFGLLYIAGPGFPIASALLFVSTSIPTLVAATNSRSNLFFVRGDGPATAGRHERCRSTYGHRRTSSAS